MKTRLKTRSGSQSQHTIRRCWLILGRYLWLEGTQEVSHQTRAVAATMTMIAEELRQQYLLGYVPSKPIAPGEDHWRTITVRVPNRVTRRGATDVASTTPSVIGTNARPVDSASWWSTCCMYSDRKNHIAKTAE